MNTTPRLIAALALATSFACTSVNAAEPSGYFHLDAGASVISDIGVKSVLGVGTSGLKIQSKTGFGFRAVSGLKLNENFALELETGYGQNDFNRLTAAGVSTNATGSASVVPILVNGVLSAKLTESISANLGAGLGAAITTADIGAQGIQFERQTKASLMGQLKTGVEFKITESVSANLNYRFGVVGAPDFDSVKTDNILTHMFTAGVGIKF
jgi:opacity protein-like surface antigen